MIIGIVAHSDKTIEGNNIKIIYDDIVKSIINNGGIPIGLNLNINYKNSIDLCDGIIFQGGDDFDAYELEALKYAYDIDKPVLGICLGMQLMGILFGGDMLDISNHKERYNYVHGITIKGDSNLFKIFNKKNIGVNSRHKSVIKSSKLKTSAISDDGYIEALEDSSKKFFIGVQWHPESMIKYDKTQNNIFEYFISKCRD